jgi:nitrite reductase/ring-hydroxylating ferredoxin subunit
MTEGEDALTTSNTPGEAAEVQLANRRHGTGPKAYSLQAMRRLRDTPPPYPFGWFAVAFSRQLRRGGVLTCRFMDREIVIFRTESGTACAIEAYCPHMGAHFGHGGKVLGEELRCPFHGFRFSVSGSCVHSPFGAPPPAARLGLLELREICGVIFIWHGPPGQVPWEVEFPDEESDWHRLRHWTIKLRSHPQEIAENGVDIGHLSVLHGFKNLNLIEPLTVDGPRLRIGYGFTQPVPLTSGFDIEMRIRIDGLGFTVAETAAAGGWAVRMLTLATPVGERETLLHFCTTMRRRGRSAVSRALWSCLDPVVGRGVLLGAVAQVTRDERIWNNKKYLRRPAIAAGDGPIPAYRQWATQFYPEGADC